MPTRIFALLMALMLLPFAALAEEFVPYEVFTFSGLLPERLKEPLSAMISDESRIVSGAAIQHNADGAARAAYSALALVDTDEGPILLAAAWVDGQPWQVTDFTRLLRRDRNVSVSIYQPEASRIPRFSVDYASPQGLTSDLLIFWNDQLWCMSGHMAQGVAVTNEMGMIAVNDDDGQEKFRCAEPFFLDYMADISAFPTSRAEAQALSWLPDYASYAAGMTLYTLGANLRQEATTASCSLGMYAENVPMIFTGEQKQGSAWPWYQVRIGSTVGWMSGNYVDDEPALGLSPVPLGRTGSGCALYAAPGDDAPLAQLAPGTTFHILAEYEGMYHICIPTEEISWSVDTAGMYGYISTEGVLIAASPSALDALENAP